MIFGFDMTVVCLVLGRQSFSLLIEIFIKYMMSAMEVMCHKIIGVAVLYCTPRVRVELEQAKEHG
jgi:uncharacterized membrane protein YdcZ (DUF606 family)